MSDTVPETPSTPESTTPPPTTAPSGRNRLLLGGIVLGVVLICLVCLGAGIFTYRNFIAPEETTVTNTGTPTPFGNAGSITGAQPIQINGMSNSGTISITVDIPVRLTIGGQTFNVQTELIGADRTWTPPLDNPDIAFWVYGSVVNYVIGMPEANQNRALLEQLAPGDEFTMTTRGGVVYTFAFSSRENVPANNDDVFAQNRPGITLLLLGGEGNERLVLRGRYVVNEADDPVDNIVNMAETAQLGSLQITVNSTTFIADRPEIPTGFAFFLVDYVIQNVGLTALDTASSTLR